MFILAKIAERLAEGRVLVVALCCSLIRKKSPYVRYSLFAPTSWRQTFEILGSDMTNSYNLTDGLDRTVTKQPHGFNHTLIKQWLVSLTIEIDQANPLIPEINWKEIDIPIFDQELKFLWEEARLLRGNHHVPTLAQGHAEGAWSL
jgi:hypothetical protein